MLNGCCGRAMRSPCARSFEHWKIVATNRRHLLDSIRRSPRRPPKNSARRAKVLPEAVHTSCCRTWRDIAIFMRAMVARRAWRERRQAFSRWLEAAGEARVETLRSEHAAASALTAKANTRRVARGLRRWAAAALVVKARTCGPPRQTALRPEEAARPQGDCARDGAALRRGAGGISSEERLTAHAGDSWVRSSIVEQTQVLGTTPKLAKFPTHARRDAEFLARNDSRWQALRCPRTARTSLSQHKSRRSSSLDRRAPIICRARAADATRW